MPGHGRRSAGARGEGRLIQEKHGWRYYAGLAFFILSFVPICTAELVLLLPLVLPITKAQAVSFTAIYLAFGEVCFLVAIALLGKPFLAAVKAKAKAFLGRFWAKLAGPPRPPRPIGRARHAVGVALFAASWLPYFITEAALLFAAPGAINAMSLGCLLIVGDFVFVASVFVLGDEFWARLKKLFEWPGTEREVATAGRP